MIKVPTDNLQGLKAWARGFEPPTFWSVAKRSIQLSYAHIKHKVIYNDIYYSLVTMECQDNILTYFIIRWGIVLSNPHIYFRLK